MLANYVGQLGDGTTTDRQAPEPVAGGLVFANIAAGDDYTCGVTRDHAMYCWGDDYVGQLGDGGELPQVSPVRVSP